jgi:hypothetical protein
MNHKYVVVIASSIGGLMGESTLAFHKITPGEEAQERVLNAWIGVEVKVNLPLGTGQAPGPGNEGSTQCIKFFKEPSDGSLLGRTAQRFLHLHLNFPAQVMGQQAAEQAHFVRHQTACEHITHLCLALQLPI